MNRNERMRQLRQKRKDPDSERRFVRKSTPEELRRRLDFVKEVVRHKGELGDAQAMQMCMRHLGPMTLREIGAFIGVTKQRTEQIEMRALHKARKCLSEGSCLTHDVPPWRWVGEGSRQR